MSSEYELSHSDWAVNISYIKERKNLTSTKYKIYSKKIKQDDWKYNGDSEFCSCSETEAQGKIKLLERLKSKVDQYQEIIKELS